MGTTVVEEPQVEEQDGAPVEGAEATHENAHLFAYSLHVHAPEGAEKCEHATDGKCEDADHFHAWCCLPNSIQMRDIEEKARAARARKRRAMRDAGEDGRPPADAYVILEAELDDLLTGDLTNLIDLMAEREVTVKMPGLAMEVREDDERFEHQDQDSEEFMRLELMAEEDRPADEYERLKQQLEDFGNELKRLHDVEHQREVERITTLSPDRLREMFRENRIDAEAENASMTSHYLWLAFVCTRKVKASGQKNAPRYFGSLDEMRSGAPEAIQAIDDAIQDLEGRFIRGDALGN